MTMKVSHRKNGFVEPESSHPHKHTQFQFVVCLSTFNGQREVTAINDISFCIQNSLLAKGQSNSIELLYTCR